MHICHPFCALSGGRISVNRIPVAKYKHDSRVRIDRSDLMCINVLTFCLGCIIGSFMITPAKRKALLASGTLNPHPEAVRSELFHTDFFDPYDLAQVKYEMLRAHSVDEDAVAEVCRQFGVSRYGVASLLPGGQPDFPFILCAQSVPRPAWSGTRDFHREKLLEVYEFLTREVMEDASRHLRPRFQREAGKGTYDWFAIRSLAELRGSEWDGDRRGVHG